MIRKHVLVAVGVLALGAVVLAVPRQGVLKDKDGRVYEGLIDEKDDTVLVNQRGIESRISRDNVQSIAYGDFDEQFQASRAALKKDDVAGRVALGRKAFDASRYDLAQAVLEEAVALDANNAEANDLLKMSLSHRRFDKGSDHTGTTGEGGTAGGTGTGAATTAGHGAWTLLNADQINRIKQLELDPANDSKINISFDKSVKSKYFDANPNLTIEGQAMDRVAWNRLSPFIVAKEIIKNGGDLGKDVRITGDPATILSFKKFVQPILLQGCATTGCHSGNNDATRKFPLINPANDNAATYTNFYVITTYKTKAPGQSAVDNVFSPTMNRMVDRAQPEQSLLLAFGLPRAMSEIKHPEVKNLVAIFNKGGKTDERYGKVLEWVKSLDDVDKETEYGFTFMPERGDSATPSEPAPTTKPAATHPTTSGTATHGTATPGTGTGTPGTGTPTPPRPAAPRPTDLPPMPAPGR